MKSARHAIILDIIEHFDIDTQEELAARLREQGVKVTQAVSYTHLTLPTIA